MIAVTWTGPVARIALDAPRSRNALGLDGWQGLAEAVAAVARSSARALLVESAQPRMFCSGSDLRAIAALADDVAARASFRLAMRAAMDPLAQLAIPVIAVVDGDCFGAGVALALACDIRVGGRGAVFAVTPAKLGITYPQEDVARLVARVGRAQATRLLCAAERIDVTEAARIGLVDIVAEDAEARALAMAEAMAANAPGSVATLKRTVAQVATGVDPALDRAFDDAFAGPDFAEGLAAFAARRAPDFTS